MLTKKLVPRPRPRSLSHSLFFNDTATTEIYTLSLHDALPILGASCFVACTLGFLFNRTIRETQDRKSTRLNSSHITISYAVFCLKKKKFMDISTASLVADDSQWMARGVRTG